MAEAVIEVEQLSKRFGVKPALRDVSLRVERGEMVALLGASGSGKSTLLRHLNGMHRGHAGRVAVLGRQVQDDGHLAADVRDIRSRVAMIYQQFNLVERLPVLTNVLAGALHRMPTWRWMLGRFSAEDCAQAMAALERVGIAGCAWQRASTLSGGQQQRAAISRALMQRAEVILADEPIASLDPESSRRVMQLLAELNRELGVTVLVSLHQIDYAFAFCPRTIALRHGEVVYDGPTAALSNERLQQLYGTQSEELLLPQTQPGRTAQPESPALAPVLQAA